MVKWRTFFDKRNNARKVFHLVKFIIEIPGLTCCQSFGTFVECETSCALKKNVKVSSSNLQILSGFTYAIHPDDGLRLLNAEIGNYDTR